MFARYGQVVEDSIILYLIHIEDRAISNYLAFKGPIENTTAIRVSVTEERKNQKQCKKNTQIRILGSRYIYSIINNCKIDRCLLIQSISWRNISVKICVIKSRKLVRLTEINKCCTIIETPEYYKASHRYPQEVKHKQMMHSINSNNTT